MNMGFAFGGTITTGIQDVSALLPLLGTEQCEEHVGSALVGGYLYASAAPLSIFGSLGIVRAGSKALVASVVVSTFRSTKVLGAKKLADAGFGPAGKALSQIMWNGKCHGAEAQLAAMLEELHITNMEKLSVKTVSRQWIVQMFLAAFVALFASLTPYVYLIKNNHKDPASVRWFFPLARSIGSLLISTMIQILIRTRLLVIIKYRIVFLILDDIVRSQKIKLPAWWDARGPSEVALHHLKLYLDEEKTANTAVLLEKLKLANERHLPPRDSRRTTLYAMQLAIACGIVLSLAGYVGCFSLVQSSTSIGPLIWLITEVILSFLRMGIWSWNPKWDETGTSLIFELELARNSPLPTCNKFMEELDKEGLVPLTKPREFLEKITSFVGLLEPFKSNEDGVALYYTMTGCEETRERALYVTILDYKANILRTFIRCSRQTTCRTAKLEVEDGKEDGAGTVWATLGKQMSMNSTYMAKDSALIEKLEVHCDSILQNLQSAPPASNMGSRKHRAVDIEMTWAMTRIPGSDREIPVGPSTLTKDDVIYLTAGKLERHRRDFCLRRNQWVDGWIPLIVETTLKTLLHVPQSVAVLYEAAVSEYLVLYEWEEMECMIVDETRRLEIILWKWSEDMVRRLGDEDLRERQTALMRDIEDSKNILDNLNRSKHNDLERQGSAIREEGSTAIAEYLETLKQHVMALEPYLEAPDCQGLAILEKSLAVLERDGLPALERQNADLAASLTKEVADLTKDLSALQDWKTTIGEDISAEWMANIMRRVTAEAEHVQGRLSEFAREARIRIKERCYRGPTEQVLRGHLQSFEERVQALWNRFKADIEKATLEPAGAASTSSRYDSDLEDLADQARVYIEAIEDQSLMNKAERELGAVQDKLNTMQSEVANRLANERRIVEERLERIARTEDDFLHECSDFSLDGSLFVARLAISKFVELPRTVVDKNGIIAIANALQRNTVVSCVNCTECTLDETMLIIKSLKKAKSVTLLFPESLNRGELSKLEKALRECSNIFSLNLSLKDVSRLEYRACRQVIEDKRSIAITDHGPLTLIYYEGVTTSDAHRRGDPYLLFSWPTYSKCVLKFSVPAVGIEHLRLRLNHRRTGNNGKVGIRLNGGDIEWDEEKCPQWDFGVQDIVVPFPNIQANYVAKPVHELTIYLREDSKGMYCLADVQIFV